MILPEELKDNEAKEIIKVINNYKNALNLLDDYDHKRIYKPSGTLNKNKIEYKECMNVIGKLKFNRFSNEFFKDRKIE